MLVLLQDLGATTACLALSSSLSLCCTPSCTPLPLIAGTALLVSDLGRELPTVDAAALLAVQQLALLWLHIQLKLRHRVKRFCLDHHNGGTFAADVIVHHLCALAFRFQASFEATFL